VCLLLPLPGDGDFAAANGNEVELSTGQTRIHVLDALGGDCAQTLHGGGELLRRGSDGLLRALQFRVANFFTQRADAQQRSEWGAEGHIRTATP